MRQVRRLWQGVKMFYIGTALKIGCVIVFVIMGAIPGLDRNWIALPLSMVFIGFGLQMTAAMKQKRKLDDADRKFKQLFGGDECTRREKRS